MMQEQQAKNDDDEREEEEMPSKTGSSHRKQTSSIDYNLHQPDLYLQQLIKFMPVTMLQYLCENHKNHKK
jgi:hypothetical protein